MPRYSYLCSRCEHCFDQQRSMFEPGPAACPACGEPEGEAFGQDFTGACPVVLVKGNITTIGQQAELNMKRIGKEAAEHLLADNALGKQPDWTGPLPRGARVNREATGETPPWRDGSMGTPAMDKPLDLNKVKNIDRYIATGVTT